MQSTVVRVTRTEYLLLVDAFDVLGGIIDQIEEETGWGEDDDADEE